MKVCATTVTAMNALPRSDERRSHAPSPGQNRKGCSERQAGHQQTNGPVDDVTCFHPRNQGKRLDAHYVLLETLERDGGWNGRAERNRR
jgi:hypothetical protein